jgi:hypothetical protein
VVIQEAAGRSFNSNAFFDEVAFLHSASTGSTGDAGGSGTGTSDSQSTKRVVWSTNFSQTDPKGGLGIEVEESSGNLSFPSPSWAQAGSRVMGVTMVAGHRNGHKFMSRFNVGSRNLGIAPMKEAYFRYRVRFPHDMDFDPDGKLPGLGGLPDDRGGWYTSSGGTLRPDSWSARIHWRRAGGYGISHPYWDAYLYAAEIDGKPFDTWGHQIRFSTGMNGAGQALRVPVGEWITVEFYVRMNTPGRADGAYKGWINGVQGVDLKNIRWTTQGTAEVNQIVAGTFVNNPGNRRTVRIDFDEMSIAAPR